MVDRAQEILDSLPQRPSRSRLAPYRELIHELRRRRRTYREIATVLAEKCQCRVSISTLHDFVRLRKRPDKTYASHRDEEEGASQIGRSGRGTHQKTTAEERKPEREQGDDVQARIAALKRRPPTAESDPIQFRFDPDTPLSLPQLNRKHRNEK